MYGVYATFEDVKAYLKGAKNANFHPQDDTTIKKFCVQMSRKFDAETDRHFVPVRQTRSYNHPGDIGTTYPYPAYPASTGPVVRPIGRYKLADELRLDDDLLQVVTLTTQNGNITISSDDYWLMTGENYNYPPYDRIRLKPNGTTTLFSYSGTVFQANQVDGYFGYHEDWAEAWQQVDTVQDDPLAAGATVVTVADVDGEDEQGLEPRFKTQQLVRFGSGATAEYSYLINKSPETNILTVKRGVNGTTATEHAQGTAIYVYRPMAEIEHALLVLAAWSYRRKDSIGTFDDRPVASPTGMIIMPNYLPPEVRDMIKGYKREPLR
jgi:hypothetical protein